jgi:hypothetical protein
LIFFIGRLWNMEAIEIRCKCMECENSRREYTRFYLQIFRREFNTDNNKRRSNPRFPKFYFVIVFKI